MDLIFERNWVNFDEMHSVYTTKYLTKEKIEEMATYCMAKFWNIDTFIDQEKITQTRTKQKKSIVDFVNERITNLGFMANNGTELQEDNFEKHIKIFLEAYIDPRVEVYTRKVGVHEVLEMTRFLRILGAQKIQCTLSLDGTNASFIFKTTNTTVEYIRIIRGRQVDATLTLDVDLKWLSEPDNSRIIERVVLVFSRNLTIKKLWNTFRLFAAVGTSVLAWNLQKLKSRKS
jgi:hypothetical protein